MKRNNQAEQNEEVSKIAGLILDTLPNYANKAFTDAEMVSIVGAALSIALAKYSGITFANVNDDSFAQRMSQILNGIQSVATQWRANAKLQELVDKLNENEVIQ